MARSLIGFIEVDWYGRHFINTQHIISVKEHRNDGYAIITTTDDINIEVTEGYDHVVDLIGESMEILTGNKPTDPGAPE